MNRLVYGHQPVPNSPIWRPPTYEKALDYCDNLNRTQQALFDIGIYKGKPLTAELCGYRSCYGSSCHDLHGEGRLRLKYNKYVTEDIECVALGGIAGYGTGILLDRRREVWLYRTPNAVDEQIPGLDCAACRIVRNGMDLREGTEIVVEDKFMDAVFEPDDPGDDSDDGSCFIW